ncbi:MAG TPA: hypothetical protein VHY79_05205, partial [Rhizomicrobium sp.]|nr:hypothetical protein [Rhizomicrobium sp.]
MRRSALVGSVIAGFVILASVIFGAAQSGPVLGFNCLGALSTPYECTSSTAVGLRGNTASGTNAVVAGANMPSDGGGGDFVDIGAASGTCGSFPLTDNIQGVGTVGSAKITGVTLTRTQFDTLTVGEGVSGGGTNIQIPPGAEIAVIDAANSHLILTLPLTGTATGSPTVSIVISGDNGGTLIVDHESTQQCWQKTNYRGDPHEFAAFGDGQTDDTIPIQNWLGAYGNVNPTLAAGTTPPPNFGPWNATIPANYLVTAPLFCPPNATLQGNSPLVATGSTGTYQGSPSVRIFAGTGFTGGSALLTTSDYCRIAGMAIDANNMSFLGLQINTVDVRGTHNSIDGRALIEGGLHNVYCGGVQVDGLQLKDAEFVKSGTDNVYLPGHCGNVRMTGDLVESSGTNGVYFGGDDLTISGGVIEESPGNGLDIESAHEVTACETYYDIDGNQTAGTAAIRIANSTTVAICGNHFQRSGGDAAGSA